MGIPVDVSGVPISVGVSAAPPDIRTYKLVVRIEFWPGKYRPDLHLQAALRTAELDVVFVCTDCTLCWWSFEKSYRCRMQAEWECRILQEILGGHDGDGLGYLPESKCEVVPS